nr:hypothetical protein [Ktedonobacter racemifer]
MVRSCEPSITVSQPRERPISHAWMASLVKVEVVTKISSRAAKFSRAPINSRIWGESTVVRGA